MSKFVFGLSIILWIIFFFYKEKYRNACRVTRLQRIASVQSVEHLKIAVNMAKKANGIAFVATFVTVFGILLLTL